MATFTAWYTIKNRTHVEIEAESEEEAFRMAKQMATDGTVLEQFGFELRDLDFALDELQAD